MKFKHFIPHVNNKELTKLAFNSVKDILEDKIVIIDNSENLEIYNDRENWLPATILMPSQPLTTAQTMNWIRQISIDEGLDVFGFQHNDAEPPIESVNKTYEEAKSRIDNQIKFGLIMGNHDFLCIFSVKATIDVGKWDWLYFPFYYLDNDYYERMLQKDYDIIYLNLECKHHSKGQNTVNSDNRRRIYKDLTDPICETLLNEKRKLYTKPIN